MTVDVVVVVISLVVVSLVLSVICIALAAVALSAPSAQPAPKAAAPAPRAAAPQRTARVARASSSARAVRMPTAPRQARTTPRVPGTVIPKLYMAGGYRLLANITEPVIDVCSFRDGLLVLLVYGNMVYRTDEVDYHLPATETIVSIVSFNNTVIGLSDDGRLFEFIFVSEDNYSWKPYLQSLSGIYYINATGTGDVLWVQMPEKGLAFDKTLDVVARKELTSDTVRVYGTDLSEYIDIERGTCTGMLTDGTSVPDVYDGAWQESVFWPTSYAQYEAGVQRVRSLFGTLYYVLARD